MFNTDENIKHELSLFSNQMRISGYDRNYRLNIIKGALNRAKEMDDKCKRGLIDRYRNRKQINNDKSNKGGNSINTWFLKGDKTSVLKVIPTPNSSLSNIIKSKIGNIRSPDGGSTMVVEMGGVPLGFGLYKADPFRTRGCTYPTKCPIREKDNCG